MASDDGALRGRPAVSSRYGGPCRGRGLSSSVAVAERPVPRSHPWRAIVSDIAGISDSTRLGIALLLSLADAHLDRVTIDTLTDATGATYAAVARILRRLAQARLVRSARGPGGGWRLSVPPNCISLHRVLRALRATATSHGEGANGERMTHRGSVLLDNVIRQCETPLVRALVDVSLADLLDMELRGLELASSSDPFTKLELESPPANLRES